MFCAGGLHPPADLIPGSINERNDNKQKENILQSQEINIIGG